MAVLVRAIEAIEVEETLETPWGMLAGSSSTAPWLALFTPGKLCLKAAYKSSLGFCEFLLIQPC